MSATVYRITAMLSSLLRDVPVGPNLGLCPLLWLSGSMAFPHRRWRRLYEPDEP